MRMRVAAPRRAAAGPPNPHSQQLWHLRERGSLNAREHRDHPESGSFPFTPKSGCPGEGLWQQCSFLGTVSSPGWEVWSFD